jgi:HAD superfamily hydrolase (TIGR01509 family)
MERKGQIKTIAFDLSNVVLSWDESNDQKVISIIGGLRKNGYSLAVLSNSSSEVREIPRYREVFKYFDHVLLSRETGAIKPDQRAYERLLKDSGNQPGEIIFVDDSPENVVQAKKAGINGIVYSDPASLITDLKQMGVIIS